MSSSYSVWVRSPPGGVQIDFPHSHKPGVNYSDILKWMMNRLGWKLEQFQGFYAGTPEFGKPGWEKRLKWGKLSWRHLRNPLRLLVTRCHALSPKGCALAAAELENLLAEPEPDDSDFKPYYDMILREGLVRFLRMLKHCANFGHWLQVD